MNKSYLAPNTKVLYIGEQHLCAASPAVNESGTETDTNNTGGEGNAGGAHAKPYSYHLWDDENSIYND